MISDVFNAGFIFKVVNISRFTSPFRGRLVLESFEPWIKSNDKILDIGCGTGIISSVIIHNFRVKVTGCDIKNCLDHKIPFYLIPKNGKLPFHDRSFDVAMLNDVLHHINNTGQKKVIREALRVAKKVLIFEDEPTLVVKIFDILLNKFHYDSLDTPLTFKTRSEWAKVFKSIKTGYLFKNVRRPFWYPFSHIAIMVQYPK